MKCYAGLEMWKAVSIVAGVVILAGCSGASPSSPAQDGGETAVPTVVQRDPPYVLQQVPELTIEVTSEAVTDNGRLHNSYTCEGTHELTPQLSWSGAPEETQSLVLVMEDAETDEPSGGIWTHWIIYSIPADVTSMDSMAVDSTVLENGAMLGTNDYGVAHYLGPCPKPSLQIGPNIASQMSLASLRPYYFRIYALDMDVELGPGADRNELLQAIEGHILAAGELAPKYRSRLKFFANSLSDFAPPSRSQRGHTWERIFR